MWGLIIIIFDDIDIIFKWSTCLNNRTLAKCMCGLKEISKLCTNNKCKNDLVICLRKRYLNSFTVDTTIQSYAPTGYSMTIMH